MRPSRPSMRVSLSLAWLLTLGLLAGQTGCGPATPGDPLNVGPRASMGGPPAGMAGHEARGVGREGGSSEVIVLRASSPVPLASHPAPSSAPLVAPARSAEPLVVPAWMANDLDSPDVRVRLKALDRWGQQAPTGSVDPLILALEDEDKRVQARALELIEQDWVRAQVGEGHEARGER